MKYWVEWALGVIVALLTAGYRRLSKRTKTANAKSEALEHGMRALLRDRIIQGYNHYMEKGCWPIYARESLLDMYRQYIALGGNGVIKDLMEDLAELPTEKIKPNGG